MVVCAIEVPILVEMMFALSGMLLSALKLIIYLSSHFIPRMRRRFFKKICNLFLV